MDAVSNHVFAPREGLSFLYLPKSAADSATWDRLSVERFNVDLQACYSSVFGEHWITSLKNPRPASVKSCDALSGPPYEANPYERDPP